MKCWEKWLTSWNQAGRNINDITLVAESEEEQKSLLKVQQEHENAGLKLNIQTIKTIAFGPNTSWKIDGQKLETVTDFILESSKIPTNIDCSHKFKRCLILGIKAMTKLDSILNNRDITFLTKVHLDKTMIFPRVV